MRRHVGAAEFACAIAEGQLSPVARGDPEAEAYADWIEKGWRPALDYFLWSEREHGDHCSPGMPSRASDPIGKDVSWSAVDEAARSARARSVGDVLMKRRTQRVFEGTELPLHAFTELLEYLCRAVGDPETVPEFSAIELHLIVYGIEGLETGAWRLDLSSRSAQRRVPGRDTDREAMSRIMCGMPAALTAAGTFVFVVDLPYRRKQYPYERALRELYVDVARLAQWIILCGESLGIGSLITPATNDLELARLIDLGEHAAPIYTLTFGPHREKRLRQTP